MLLAAEHVSLARAGQPLLSDVSFSLQAGQIMTVIGPNGAGKTTLLRVILGLLEPDSGMVRRASQLRLGYMPQKLQLNPQLPLTVFRFLQLAASPKPAIEHALEITSIVHLRRHAMATLSGGELQRVLLARALLRQPNVLVLDEPVQGVDITGQAAMYQLIGQLRDQLGCAVLMVSHDLHLVMAATDQVLCLNKHVCCAGHPSEVSAHPEYLQLFGQATDPALAVYTHNHDHTHDQHHCPDHPEAGQ